ncbi:MAG: hypothetical protein H6622_17495 [Halobacteriovoraceae bacterium]|nr:hypothetical protein [Halobacteriovoraceae bacterium]
MKLFFFHLYLIFCISELYSAVYEHKCEALLGKSSALKEILKSVEDSQQIKRHPLGLVYMNFDYKGLKFRIHFYPEVDTDFKQKHEEFPAHAHDWYLNSFILKGKLANHIYEFIVDSNGIYSKYITKRKLIDGKDTSLMVKSELKGYVVKTYEELIHAGQSYQMSSQINHDVSNLKFNTITIVHGPRDRIENEAATSIGRSDRYETSTPVFNRDRTDSKLTREFQKQMRSLTSKEIELKLEHWINSLLIDL